MQKPFHRAGVSVRRRFRRFNQEPFEPRSVVAWRRFSQELFQPGGFSTRKRFNQEAFHPPLDRLIVSYNLLW